MKKIISILCFTILVVNTTFALDTIFTKSNQLERNGYGYGWRFPFVNRASYDPDNGYMAANYLKKYTDSFGFSTIIGSDFDNLVPFDVQPNYKCYYPAGTVFDGYYFAVWSQINENDQLLPMFTTYDIAEDEWAPITPLPEYTGKYTGAYFNQCDVTKDTDANYVMLTTQHYYDSTDGSDGILLMRGVTSDPLDPDSWNWSEILKTEIGTWSKEFYQGPAMRIICGYNGMTLIANDDMQITETDTIQADAFGYLISNDYGLTWNTPSIDKNGYYTYNKVKYHQISAHIGKKIYNKNPESGAIEEMVIDYVDPASSSDYALDNYGNIFAVNWTDTGFKSNTTMISNYYDTEGNPVSGWSIYKATKTTDGYNWAEIATVPPVGIVKANATTLEDISGSAWETTYSNTKQSSITVGNNGFVAFSTNDRPETNPIACIDYFGESMDNHMMPYFTNPYVIASQNGGNSFDCGNYEFKTGYNLTENSSNCDAYFKFAKKAKIEGSDYYATKTMIGAYGEPNLDEIVAGTTVNWEDISLDIRLAKVQIVNSSHHINEDLINSPKTFDLAQNYPNPFNPTTTISFKTSQKGKVNLNIYNAKGQLVENLVNKTMNSGIHSTTFNAANLNSGIYFYELNINENTITKKMVLTK